MQQLKLIKLLKTLSKDEYLRFGKFLRSPFFNYATSFVDFYEALKRLHPDFSEKKWKPEKIWEKVFPDKPFSEQKFWRLCSDLSRLTEQYLVQLELEQPKPAAQHLLIQSLGRRNAYDLFEKKIQTRLKELDKEEMRNAAWFGERVELLEEWSNHPLKNKLDKNDTSLRELMESLDAYFLLQKSKFSIGLISLHKLLKREYEVRYLSILEAENHQSAIDQNILFQLYRASLNLLQHGNEVDFNALEKLLFVHLNALDKYDRNLFFFNGLNFAIRKMNRGETGYGKVVLKWYMKGLEEKILFHEKYLSVTTFQNIIQISCKSLEFEFAENFIQNYNVYLKEELREDNVYYNLGLLHFHQNNFDKTISILMKENWVKELRLSARNLLARALFEQFLKNEDYYSILQNTLQSFEFYLLRTKEFPKTRTEPHLNFARILKTLSNKILRKKSNEYIDTWLDIQLSKKKPIISKKWLRNRLKKK